MKRTKVMGSDEKESALIESDKERHERHLNHPLNNIRIHLKIDEIDITFIKKILSCLIFMASFYVRDEILNVFESSYDLF